MPNETEKDAPAAKDATDATAEPLAAEAEAIPETPKGKQLLKGDGWKQSSEPAEPFVLPKRFPTRAQLIRQPDKVPLVTISRLALTKMHIYVGSIDLEVGWLGSARRTDDGFAIDDVFLFDQEVDSARTHLSTDSISQVADEVIKLPNAEELFRGLCFWGHSHVRMGTSPSHQDNETMQVISRISRDFMIRGILNRVGRIELSVFDWASNLAYHDTPWTVGDDELSEEAYRLLLDKIPKEMALRVKRMKMPFWERFLPDMDTVEVPPAPLRKAATANPASKETSATAKTEPPPAEKAN